MAGLGVMAISVAGCGSSPAPVALPSPSLTIGVVTPLATLNPVTMGTSEEANFASFVWAGLLGVDAKGYPFPELAQQVPSQANGLISASGTRITFHLRNGLRWSDGQPITASDVVFGWRLATQTWADVCPATCWAIRSIQAESPMSVTFVLSRPFSPLLFDLPPVVPRHFIWKGSWRQTESFLFQPSSTWFGRRFPVDGPFQVTRVAGSAITMTRNPFWHILSTPGFASVQVTTYPTDPALLSAVESGAVGMAQGFDIMDFRKGIIDAGKLGGLKLRLYPTGGLEHLELNVRPRRPLSDVRLRQALSLAIDRAALVAGSLGIPLSDARKLVAYGPEFPGRFDGQAVSGIWDPIRNRFVVGPSLADANSLLYRAGHPLASEFRFGGRTLFTLLIPKTYQDRITAAQNYLQKLWGRRGAGTNYLGIKTKLDFTQYAIGNLIAPYKQHGPCAQGKIGMCDFAQLPGYDPQTDFQLEFTSSHDSLKEGV